MQAEFAAVRNESYDMTLHQLDVSLMNVQQDNRIISMSALRTGDSLQDKQRGKIKSDHETQYF